MDIQLPQIIFQIINFGVVAGALTYLLYKPVKKMLDERSAKVEEAQKAAEITIAEKHQIDEVKKKVQKEAEKEAAKILLEAKQTAEKMEKEIVMEATQKAKADVQRLYKEWEGEKAGLIKSLKINFANEVVNVVSQVIGTSIDPKTLTKQIDQSVEEIAQKI